MANIFVFGSNLAGRQVYTAMTEDHIESIEIGGTHDWPASWVVALIEIAGVTE